MVFGCLRRVTHDTVHKRRHRMGRSTSPNMNNDSFACAYQGNANGTQVVIGQAQHDCLALELSWFFTSAPVKLNKDTWKFSIEMTYGTRLTPHYQKPGFGIGYEEEDLQNHLQNPPSPSEAPFKWAPLRPVAFRPKPYTITLSRGRFCSPWDVFCKTPYPIFQTGYKRRSPPSRFLSQLMFDVSPFPPREEFAEGMGLGTNPHNLDIQQYWDIKVFVRDSTKTTWAEYLDPWWWFSPMNGEWNIRLGY